MSFDLQTIAAVIFLGALTLFVFFHKKGRTIHKLLYPILYLTMYRTTWGLKLMDMAARHKKVMRTVGFLAITLGFIGMIFISYVMVDSLINLFTKPEAPPSVGPVLPFKAKGVFFVPFFYWIISLLIIAVVHEFSHGMIARAYNIPVKSSGFAFFSILIPVIPLAFVEPDEKVLAKRPLREQLAVFAAGPFSNFVLGFLCLGILLLIFLPLSQRYIQPSGVAIVDYVPAKNTVYPAQELGLKDKTIIGIDNRDIKTVTNLSNVLKEKKPGQTISLHTNRGTYALTLGANPDNSSQAYLGAMLEQSLAIPALKNKGENIVLTGYSWSTTLLYFLFMLNIGVGLFNLVPLGPLDGGRMFKSVIDKKFDAQTSAKIFGIVGIIFLGIIVVNLYFSFFR